MESVSDLNSALMSKLVKIDGRVESIEETRTRLEGKFITTEKELVVRTYDYWLTRNLCTAVKKFVQGQLSVQVTKCRLRQLPRYYTLLMLFLQQQR